MFDVTFQSVSCLSNRTRPTAAVSALEDVVTTFGKMLRAMLGVWPLNWPPESAYILVKNRTRRNWTIAGPSSAVIIDRYSASSVFLYRSCSCDIDLLVYKKKKFVYDWCMWLELFNEMCVLMVGLLFCSRNQLATNTLALRKSYFMEFWPMWFRVDRTVTVDRSQMNDLKGRGNHFLWIYQLWWHDNCCTGLKQTNWLIRWTQANRLTDQLTILNRRLGA